jgi:hypothetical protein
MSDKRKVSTDALETLGMIHTRDEKRDAIHLAVLPAEAGQTLRPGADVEMRDGVARAVPSDHPKAVGIVDPFLHDSVRRGERFWLVIYPRKIQSLRHVWSHPAFPDEQAGYPPAHVDDDAPTVNARAAIHAVAVDLGVSDDALMAGAQTWLESDGSFDGYMCFGNDLSYSWDMASFWNAYALLTGEEVPEKYRQAFFSCAC